MEVDLLHALDLAGLHQTTELGDGLPLLLVVLAAAPASTTTPTTASAAITATVATGSEAAATGSTGSSISHICDCAGAEAGFVAVGGVVDRCGSGRRAVFFKVGELFAAKFGFLVWCQAGTLKVSAGLESQAKTAMNCGAWRPR